MSKPHPYKLNADVPDPGEYLIEASAGTGKTYTLAGIYLQLLLQRGLSVREILVVTYTEAATQELRERIWTLLAKALAAFQTGESSDPMLLWILERFKAEKVESVARLEQAISGFDEAAIYTIHGFCQRVLKDRAFESGQLFDVDLITDQSALLREVAEDYWRLRFYECSPLVAGSLVSRGYSPKSFLRRIRVLLNHPELRILSPAQNYRSADLAARFEQQFQRARECWLLERDNLRSFFGAAQQWCNKPYNRDDFADDLFSQLDACLSGSGPAPSHFECFKVLCSASLAAAVNRKRKLPVPEHPFFELCEDLCHTGELLLERTHLDFIEFVKEELPRRKAKLKVQSFDDLLTRLHAALRAELGEALCKELQVRYRAALIDEFQDTDPLQHDIFRRVFRHPQHWLFLIGDPKQAIYGFRGADIFTYINAARHVNKAYTLNVNWRSDSDLVQAVNTIFSRHSNAFVFADIRFRPASAQRTELMLESSGDERAPFELWLCQSPDGEVLTKHAAEAMLPQVIGAEIVRLLNGDTRIDGKPLRPQDIAVLVMENRQAERMQEALSQLNIPSVLHTASNVFESREARDLERVLTAIAHPANEPLLKAALTTDLLGMTGEELQSFLLEPAAPAAFMERFHRYLETWVSTGFVQMFRAFLLQERVRPRLLQFWDGDRRVTNLLHLGELLHKAALEHHLGVTGLLKWLAEKIEGNTPNDEEQLRLERDDNAVRLVTIHKSKGLEYGVVFCPFSWKAASLGNSSEEEILFHDPEDLKLTQDFGSAEMEQNRLRALEERLAEFVRLFYVALTRAKHRCYLVWGRFNKSEISAPAWLFHPPAAADAHWIETLKTHMSGLTETQIWDDLQSLASEAVVKNGSPISIRQVPEPAPDTYSPEELQTEVFTARHFSRPIPRQWRVSSFSSFLARRSEHLPDRDTIDLAASSADAQDAVLESCELPRGPKAGNCLHAILERFDFAAASSPESIEWIRKNLQTHALGDDAFVPVVCDMLARTASVPLLENESGLTLSSIPGAQRLSELEFHFPIRQITRDDLRGIFAEHGRGVVSARFPARMEQLQFNPVEGFVKGFIDAVIQHEGRYYIIDWKSNWLGRQPDRYTPAAIEAEMLHHHYILQYHLYVLALDQYLRQRLPGYEYDTHFGGVFYLFLRGIDPARPDLGIFRDRPPAPLIQALRDGLLTESIHSAP